MAMKILTCVLALSCAAGAMEEYQKLLERYGGGKEALQKTVQNMTTFAKKKGCSVYENRGNGVLEDQFGNKLNYTDESKYDFDQELKEKTLDELIVEKKKIEKLIALKKLGTQKAQHNIISDEAQLSTLDNSSGKKE